MLTYENPRGFSLPVNIYKVNCLKSQQTIQKHVRGYSKKINMKYGLLIITAFLLSFTNSDKPIERIGASGPYKFNETKFELKWSAKPNENYYVQEYLPKGESLESFNQMLICNLFVTDLSIEKAVQQKISELKKRQKTDATCKFLVTESPDGKEFIVDFLMGESKDGLMTVVEFNVYRYKKIKIDKNKEGLLVFAYSKRSYGEDITSFYKSLKTDRKKHLNEMISFNLPKIKLK